MNDYTHFYAGVLLAAGSPPPVAARKEYGIWALVAKHTLYTMIRADLVNAPTVFERNRQWSAEWLRFKEWIDEQEQ